LALSEQDAYTWLRKAAMDQRLSLAEVARRTIEGVNGASGPGSDT